MVGRRNVGIDIGGTKVHIGIVNEDGTVQDSIKMPSKDSENTKHFVADVYRQTLLLLKKNEMDMDDISFIGGGVPGTVNSRTGFVEYCPNLYWENLPIGGLLSEEFGRKVVLAQDTRLAALAEYHFGAGRGYSDIFCVAVGTGIGAGIILDGKIYSGRLNTAGELGHTILKKNGRKCSCGRRGCLERYASGTGIFERASEEISPEEFGGLQPRCESVFELAKQGNEKAKKVIDDCVKDLALGISNAVGILAPEIVIIAGGLCENEELFVKPLEKYINDYGYYSWTRQKKLQICKARLGSNAAMIGASILNRGL